ncbi:MAG: cell division protein SepF [Fusobacteriaceae bacterium]
MGVVKWFKQISGIEENGDEQELYLNEEQINNLEKEEPKMEKENKKNWEKKELEFESISKNEEEDTKNNLEDENTENCQTVFIDPKSFGDCKKIANYIKQDRMVTLNLEYLDLETAQRMLDFLMGAMLVKGASFIEISKKVYTAVPKSVKVHYDGKKTINNKTYMDIRED